MPRKRKVEKAGGSGEDSGGREAVKVKIVKNDVSSDVGGEGNCEADGPGNAAVVTDDLPLNQNEGMMEDWRALLAIFPEEVWNVILNDIKDPEMLTSLSNASPVFRALLLPRRVQFLFPKVWDILGPKYHKEAGNIISGDKAYRELFSTTYTTPLPWKRPLYLTWYTGIIKLRMVCRTWCDAMDHWYQNQSFRYKFVRERDHPAGLLEPTLRDIHWLSKNKFVLSLPNKPQRFCNHFESTHCGDGGVAIRNPFLGRVITLQIGGDDEESERDLQIQSQFLDRLRALLSKYGRHVWYLTIHVYDNYSTGVVCYAVIRSLLRLVPNLRILHLHYRPFGIFRNLVKAAREQDCHRLESYIALNPLPKFKSLRFLTTMNRSVYMPPPLFQELIRSNGHVSSLEIGHHCDNLKDICIVSFPNLRELSVKLESLEDFETFFSGDVDWRLSKLDLELEEATSLEWGRVFEELTSKWKDTLTTLILHLPWVESVEDQNRLLEKGGNLRLGLPRLTHLKLSLHNLCSMDFLLPMKDTLEVLELKMIGTVQPEDRSGMVTSFENGRVIQFLSIPDKPMESNIWTLFPKLKLVQLEYRAAYTLEYRKTRKLGSNYYGWKLTRSQWENWRKQSRSYRRKTAKTWKTMEPLC